MSQLEYTFRGMHHVQYINVSYDYFMNINALMTHEHVLTSADKYARTNFTCTPWEGTCEWTPCLSWNAIDKSNKDCYWMLVIIQRASDLPPPHSDNIRPIKTSNWLPHDTTARVSHPSNSDNGFWILAPPSSPSPQHDHRLPPALDQPHTPL